MSALKKERDVILLSLKALTTPKNIPQKSTILSMTELMAIIEKVYKSGRHYAVFNANGTLPSPKKINLHKQSEINSDKIKQNIIFISDFSKDKSTETYRILFKRGNPDIANPSFTNISKNTTRSIDPNDDETIGYSAHLVISYKDKHKAFDGYRATLEQIGGLSRSVVLPYLNGLISDYTKVDPRFSYVMSNKETARYRPSIRHLTNPSSSLKKDLKKGYLSSVELVDRRAENVTGMDDSAELKHVSRRLHFHLKPMTSSKKVKSLLQKLRKKAADESYDYIRVSLRDSEREKYVSSRFEIAEKDAFDKLYSKAEIISDFAKDLKSCYDAINEELAGKLAKLIDTDKKW